MDDEIGGDEVPLNSVFTKAGNPGNVFVVVDVIVSVAGGVVGDREDRESGSEGRVGATPEMKPPAPARAPERAPERAWPAAGKKLPEEEEVRGEAEEEGGEVESRAEGSGGKTSWGVAVAADAGADVVAEAAAAEAHWSPKYMVFLYMPLRSTCTEGNPRRIT